MDRNREARRATNMAAPPNGLSSSRRRHRSSSLRDSPDEDGGVELQEPGRLRDRGVVKKDRGDRDRDRERERERSSRSKRRRENRMMIHHVNAGSNRDDGDDTSEESVNDEDEEDDEDAGNGGGLRMLPPPAANSSTVATAMTSNHHNHHPHPHPQQLHHRKSFPPAANKVFRPAAPPPAWKAADEMIGVSVPRKARSASTKRSHEWISSGAVVGVGGGTEHSHRQSSTSPTRHASAAASPAPVAPPSPSSSNVSVRKKMKANGGGSKPRPPKSSSKSSSSNPEELEIEIAEVLYGLMTQSQAPPSKKEIPSNDSTAKFDSNKSTSDTKSPHNSTSLSTVAPKRKRPRQVAENPFGVRSSPVSSIKTEVDHHQHHQSPKTDISSPYLEHNNSGSAAENGVSFGFTGHQPSSAPPPEPPLPAGEGGKCGVGVVLTKEEAEKESPAVGLPDGNKVTEAVIVTASSNLKAANPENESQKEEKFEIDLMAPPPQQRTSPENGEIDFSDHKQISTQETSKNKEDEKLRKSSKEETLSLTEDNKKSKAGTVQETGESSKQAMNEEQLHIDLEKPNKDNTSNRSLHQALKHQQLSAKSETQTEKTGQPSSIQMPMSMANWPPMGYVAPLQGVISMDGNNMPSAPIQPMPIFTHPRPKKCATHCYIARNIHYLQQFMKINPFWPPASSSTPMFGPKPSTESTQVNIFPGQHTTTKENKSSQPTTVPEQRKQQVLLQQTMPPVTPNNILHGPAFIFPFNQQQAVTASASASVRPKQNASSAGGSVAANSATVSATSAAASTPALSFNYPNMSANETQYLAILQNNPYTFPIPAVGAPTNYRNNPHAQPMPLFNGNFYSSQMIHSSQIPQPSQQPPPTNSQQLQQTHQNSSGSTSSSQKHLQAQQRQQQQQQQSSNVAVNGGQNGTHKSRSHSQQMNPPLQARHLDNDAGGGEDSPSTAESRVSRAPPTMSVYGHNFAMPVQNFGLMNPNDKKQQLKRGGAESASLPPGTPQTFAMSFAPMNGATGAISSMAQHHAIFQSLPESLRQSYHHMMSAPGHHSQQKKDFRVTEEASRTTGQGHGHDSGNGDDDRKGSSGQSIAFSRPDLATDASGSSPSVIDSSSRNINLGSNNRSTRSPVPATPQSSHHLHAQFQQQQVLQLQKQQQQQQQNHNHNQNMNARTKNPDHLITSSSSSMAAKFPNSLSSYPLQTTNTNSSSPVQSPQWRNPVRGPTSSSSSTTPSLKNLQQQQSSRPHQQSHTQISFGSQKPPPTTTSSQNHNPNQNINPVSNSNSNNNNNQSLSPPMLVGSPTTSSLSKGANTNASPRTNTASSLSSSQPSKNAPQRSSPSILGNPNKPQQQQQQKPTLQQAQAQAHMFFTHPYMQGQQQHSGGSTAAGYYLPRIQQPSQPPNHHQTNSSSMLSLCPPVTLANATTTSDPAKAIAAATSSLKGGVSQQGVLHGAQYGGGPMPAGYPQYVHNGGQTAVQVKPAEQKQPAGE